MGEESWWVIVPVGGRAGAAFWADEETATAHAMAGPGQTSLFYWTGGHWEEHRFPFVEPPPTYVLPDGTFLESPLADPVMSRQEDTAGEGVPMPPYATHPHSWPHWAEPAPMSYDPAEGAYLPPEMGEELPPVGVPGHDVAGPTLGQVLGYE